MTADIDAVRRVKRTSFLGSVTGVFAVLLGALTALTQVVPAGAVDATGMFEMDGNVAHDSATAPPYDWASLFDASGNRLVTPDPVNGPVFGTQFLSDAAVPDQSYFSSNGAGVKDIDTLNNWGCTTINNPLDKDNLLNAYAALIQVPAGAPENAGDTVLYLGSERGSNNGTSFAGFWLFKDKNVGCNTGTGGFNGAHQVGDLLVVSDYTNGGSAQDVSVYKWVGGNTPLSLVLSGGVCPTPPTASGDSACAIANPLNKPDTPITSPWSPTSHPGNTFVEAAIDLNDLFAAEGGGTCFTTFMAESRSSNELTATLKDFSGGQLNTCFAPPMVTTALPGGSSVLPGTAQHDAATITGAPNKAAPTGTIAFTLCGPSDVDSTGCPAGKGTQVGNPAPVANGGATSGDVTGLSSPNDLALGKYCWRTDYTPDAASTNLYDPSTHTNAGSECFTVVKGSPNLTTQIGVTGNGGAAATTLADTATLHSFVGSVSTETITFNLFGPYAAGTTPTCATGTNEPVFTTTGTMNASGVATTSNSFQPQTAGQYVWVAHYGGNALNNSADGACTDANESTTIAPPVIHVTKTHDAASVSAGSPIGFTVTISNTGTGTATGITLTDSLPGGNAGAPVHWVIDSGTGNPSDFQITGGDGGQALSVTAGGSSLTSGSSISVHVTAATTSTSCATYDNTASVTTGNDGTDHASASETVLCASIHVNKTADLSPVNAGDGIGFTVTIANTGSGDATGLSMTDALPGGNAATPVHWVIDGTTGNPSAFQLSGGDGSQALSLVGTPGLAAGHSLVVHVTASTTKTSCTTYDNTASATAANDGSDQHSAEVVVQCPSISETKTADATSVSAGTGIGFTVTIANGGPGTAYGLSLNDPLPGGNAGAPVHWVIDAGTGNPSAFQITGGDGGQSLSLNGTPPISLNSGGSLSVHVTAATTSTSCATYNNTATVTITNGSGDQKSASEQVLCASVHITKTADATSVSAGTAIGFTVTVTNTGAGQATGVNLSDALPGGNAGAAVHWVIDSGTGNPTFFQVNGSDGGQSLVLKNQPTTLASGASLQVHVTAATDKTSCTTYDNTASVTTGNDGSDQKSASETVLCPSIHVDKTADAASVSAGTGIGFTVTVSNTGLGDATGLSLTDNLPGGNVATPVHWVIDSGTGNPSAFQISGGDGSQSLSLTVTTLNAGASLVVHVTAATTKTSCTTYDNTAAATAGNDGGDQHSASETVLCPSIDITKTSDAGTVSAGQAIGYSVTVSNGGPGDATAVTLTDALPGGNAATPVHWVIDTTKGDFGSFAVSGPDGSQQLTLNGQPVAMKANSSLTVHLLAATSPTSCTVYDNSATASATNGNSKGVGPVEITVQCPDLSILKTAVPAGPVSTGQSIGFTVTVSNSGAQGTGTALGVTMDDPLPAGSGINWAISPAFGGPGTCSISGAVGSQVLDCSLGDMAPGASITVGIASPTTGSSAGHYDNTATAQASNNPPVDSTAGVTVLAPGLNIAKTADAASVASGSSIGFTVSVTNAGPGIAATAALNDPLPSASGVSWTISPAYSGPGTCTVNSDATGQTLVCAFGDMAANASASVHVTSLTTTASCTTFPNTATASAGNQDSVQASATTSVICSQVQGITTPNTGADPDFRGSAALVGSGLILLLTGGGLGRKRRRFTARRRFWR